MKIYFKRSKPENCIFAYVIRPVSEWSVSGDCGERYLVKIKRPSRFPKKWFISTAYIHLYPCMEEGAYLRESEPFFNNLKEVKIHLEKEYFIHHL